MDIGCITKSLLYGLLLAASTTTYAADPVAYTSLGADDFLSTYNRATRSPSGLTSVAENATTFALSPDGTTAYIGSTGVAAVLVATGATLWKHGTTLISSVSVSPDGAQVYSLDSNVAVLHIYNAATGALLSNVTLPGFPTEAAATPDHSQIYVTGIKGIAVVSGITFTVSTTIPRSLYSGVAVSPDGGDVYVSATSGGAVGLVIDTSSNTVAATIPGSYGAVGAVVLSPDGGTAYFASDNGLIEVSTATNKVTGTIHSSSISFGLNLATDGTYVYYAAGLGQGPGFIQFDLPESTYTAVSLGGAAVGVQVDAPASKVYVLQTMNTVLTADPVSGTVTGNLGAVAGTRDLVVSGGGNAVVGGNTRATGNQTLEQVSIFSTVHPLERQVSIPINSGGLFAVNPDASSIYIVSASSPFTIEAANLDGVVQQTLLVTQLNGVEAPFFAASPEGSALYAGGVFPNMLCKIGLPAFTVSTCVTVPAELPLSTSGRTIAVSNDGKKLYVSTGGYGILEYDTSTLSVTRTLNPPAQSTGNSEVIYSAAANSIYLTYSLPNSDGGADIPYVASVSLDTFQIAATKAMSFAPVDIAISPDGSEFLVAGASYGTVVLNGATFAPERVIPTGLTQSVAVAAQ
jgi:DNA-binding beta-propeller fold protein YncE